jgi:hypothetical protein
LKSLSTSARAIGVTASLLLLGLVPAPATADIAVPKTTWPVCDDFRVDYCIESISIKPIGTKSDLELEWYPTGTGPSISPAVEAEAAADDGVIFGSRVITPGATGMYTITPIDASASSIVTYSGVGTVIKSPPDASGIVTVTITTAVGDQGSGLLKVYADADGDGNGDSSEQIAQSSIAVGTASAVGTGVTETQAGRAVNGRWSHPNWGIYGLDAYGYDGVTIDLKAANAFTNHLFFTIYPVKAGNANSSSIATRTDSTGNTANMNMDDKITVKVRMGAIRTGVSIGIANSLVLSATPGAEDNEATEADESITGTLAISGTPVPVPQVTKFSQCTGETGVASAVVNTMQAFILVENGDMGFGVDGLSGRMVAYSNGVSCGVSTPVWDDTTETLTWQASAPHFEPDGVTPNKGFYKAIIPANDALLLWGLADPTKVVSALTIQVTTEAGGPAVAASKIAYLRGNIIIDVTGFEFSKPKIMIKKLSSFRGFIKAKTIVCTDPVTKKKVTLTNSYGCPVAVEKPVQTFLTAKFANTTSSVNAAQQKAIVSMQRGFLEANKFICTGVYAVKASASEKLIAKKRATAVCNYAKGKDKTLSYFAQAKPSAASNYVGKVMVTMKNQP